MLPRMKKLLRIAAGLASLAPATLSSAQPASGDDPVTARLIGETTALVPGQVFHLGVSFEIDEGWHMYWKNPGESGAAPRIKLDLPGWLTAGETQWPTPDRLVLPGDILDYVHHDTLTLIVPLTVAQDAPIGEAAEIRAELWWLMCDDEMCIPGGAETSLQTTVSAESSPSPFASRFDSARRTHPVTPPTDALHASLSGETLTLVVPGATSLTFLPGPRPSPAPSNMVYAGAADADRLVISFDDGLGDAAAISGTLVVRDASNKPRFWRVEVPTH